MNGAKKFNVVVLICAILLMIGSFFIVSFSELTITSPGGYASLMSVVCVILSAVNLFLPDKSEGETVPLFNRTIIAFMIMLVLYLIGIVYLHYTIATLLFLFCAIFYLKRESWKQAILISYMSTFMILLIFKYIFSVIMP